MPKKISMPYEMPLTHIPATPEGPYHEEMKLRDKLWDKFVNGTITEAGIRELTPRSHPLYDEITENLFEAKRAAASAGQKAEAYLRNESRSIMDKILGRNEVTEQDVEREQAEEENEKRSPGSQ